MIFVVFVEPEWTGKSSMVVAWSICHGRKECSTIFWMHIDIFADVIHLDGCGIS
ncbi:hypothetical protein HanRHA438_Chr14g0665761 [Helianthus annuus]|nr:hypothetical protein HanRHA438_Chr14g0665761 [Helianthus annuus]